MSETSNPVDDALNSVVDETSDAADEENLKLLLGKEFLKLGGATLNDDDAQKEMGDQLMQFLGEFLEDEAEKTGKSVQEVMDEM